VAVLAGVAITAGFIAVPVAVLLGLVK